MNDQEIPVPADIRARLLKSAKGWLLGNYVGGKRRLSQWNDDYAHLVSIRSYELPGNSAANLRRLVKLTNEGVLTERRRYREKVGTRTFDIPRHTLDEIGAEAVAYWESLGYVIGELMDVTEEHMTARNIEQWEKQA